MKNQQKIIQRVLFASENYDEHAKRFIRSLKKEYKEVFYLHTKYVNSDEYESNVKNIYFICTNICKYKNINLLINIFRLKIIILQIKPDIIHVGPLHNLGYLFSRLGFRNLIVMSHAYDIQYCAKINLEDKNNIKYTILKSKLVLCDCQNLKEEIINEYDCPDEKISVFPWGINLNDFFPIPLENKHRPIEWEENKIFIHTRKLQNEIYNVSNIVQAFISVVKTNRDILAIFLGDGKLKVKFEAIIKDLNLEKSILFLGEKSNAEIRDYLVMADFYISGSTADGSSVSLMESFACGIPALVSETPCNKEWVINDMNGYTFNQNQIYQIENVIIKCKNLSEQKYSILSNNARKTAEEKANWELNQKILFKAYKDIFEKKIKSLV